MLQDPRCGKNTYLTFASLECESFSTQKILVCDGFNYELATRLDKLNNGKPLERTPSNLEHDPLHCLYGEVY